jgi:hypothetical protein
MVKTKRKTPKAPVPDAGHQTVDLVDLMPLYGDGGWRERNRHLFNSEWTLRWFCGRHRERLFGSGAVLQLNGRLFCDPPRFERLVREIGAEQMKTRMAAAE